MKEKFFRDLYEQIEVPKEDVRGSVRSGLHKAEIRGKKKSSTIRKLSVAMIILFTTVITLTFTFPSFAEKLPFIGSVYELFKNETRESVFEQYDNYSTMIGETKESNGISVTITDAVYDGENITIAYLMESEKDLGKRPAIIGDLVVDELGDKYKDRRFSENYIIEKINAHQYAVIYIYQLIDGPKPEELHVKWKGHTIRDLNNGHNEFLGEWSFELNLITLDQELQQFANSVIKTEEEGIKITVVKKTETPISTTFYLSEKVDIRKIAMEEEDWRGVQIEYMVTDNLGNEYDTIHFGDRGHSTDFTQGLRSKPRITTTVIHEDATSVIITPFINIYRMVNSDGWLELVQQPYSIKPIVVPLTK